MKYVLSRLVYGDLLQFLPTGKNGLSSILGKEKGTGRTAAITVALRSSAYQVRSVHLLLVRVLGHLLKLQRPEQPGLAFS